MNDFLLFVLSVFVIVSAKWTIGLGINQFRQLLWATAGLFAGPLVFLLFFASDSVLNLLLNGASSVKSISRFQRVCTIGWNLCWLLYCLRDALCCG